MELAANEEQRLSLQQSYRSHLAALNLMCGIADTSAAVITDVNINLTAPVAGDESIFMEKYRLDSLGAEMSLRSFNLQYRPRLDLFVDGGMQTGSFSQWDRRRLATI